MSCWFLLYNNTIGHLCAHTPRSWTFLLPRHSASWPSRSAKLSPLCDTAAPPAVYIHTSVLLSHLTLPSPDTPVPTSPFSIYISIPALQIGSVQCSPSGVSHSLRPPGLQHTRPPCPSPTPGVYSNSCPLCRWCHPTISSPIVPFSSCLQSFPASGSFQMSQLSASGGQRIGVSASASVLPMNTQDWSPLGWTGWISLQSKGLSRVFSNITNRLIPIFLDSYKCINIKYLFFFFFFWLTSLCMTRSRFIHITATTQFCSFLWLSNDRLYICTATLSIFSSMDT